MLVPKGRGQLSEQLFRSLRDELPLPEPNPEHFEDAQIALWVLYELHYRGFEDASDHWEWHPSLLQLRHLLERDLESQLRERFVSPSTNSSFPEKLFDYIAHHDGPSIASYVQRHANEGEVLELLRHRSIYHLKESDQVAWVVPRLTPVPKAALMELQYDEYGAGNPNRLHAHLFAQGMAACGLRPEYGAYIDEAPIEILEMNNAMSLFGLHHRLRGAALGHLAAFEATSSIPSRKMSQGLARLRLPAPMIEFYDEHVEADAVHEQLAVRAICGPLVEAEPELADDVMFGAFTCLDLEDRFARRMLTGWSQ